MSRIASVVLRAAPSARSGDIATDLMDDQPLPFLCNKDITKKLVEGKRFRISWGKLLFGTRNITRKLDPLPYNSDY